MHWAVEPARVAPLLPDGVQPDLFDGTSYVGLVAFRMYRIGLFGLPGLPYVGSFPETNVRLYSVSHDGRRDVVFRSLESSRLVPVVVARWIFRLPYLWARMRIERDGVLYSPGLPVRFGDPERLPRTGAIAAGGRSRRG